MRSVRRFLTCRYNAGTCDLHVSQRVTLSPWRKCSPLQSGFAASFGRCFSKEPNHFQDGFSTSREQEGNGLLLTGTATCQLVRDYISDSLYNPKYGYFPAHPEAVGVIQNPIDFKKLAGKREYQQLLNHLYKNSNKSWLTPVEIFQPWYGYALGEYILRLHDPKKPLKIYEIGGGSGTCAANIMDYIKSRAPTEVYEQMKYTSVEISRPLADRQVARLKTETVTEHMERFSVQQHSAADARAWGEPNDEPCFVIMLEVLDNLTHDRVERGHVSEEFKETWVEEKVSLEEKTMKEVIPTEVLRPLNDDVIKKCLTLMGMIPDKSKKGQQEKDKKKTLISSNPLFRWIQRFLWSQVFWIPTGCLTLFETLHYVRPNMTLIAADFSSLPDVKISGVGAPLVASKEGGVTTDHSTFLVPKGSSDIFFPTNFALLQLLDTLCSQRSHTSDFLEKKSNKERQKSRRISAVVQTHEFMQRYADVTQTQLKNGYNPLLQDFSNTKIFLSVSKAG